jgi:hypothetical protein
MPEVETEGFAREARTWICREGPKNSHGRRVGRAGNRSDIDGAEVITPQKPIQIFETKTTMTHRTTANKRRQHL